MSSRRGIAWSHDIVVELTVIAKREGQADIAILFVDL